MKERKSDLLEGMLDLLVGGEMQPLAMASALKAT